MLVIFLLLLVLLFVIFVIFIKTCDFLNKIYQEYHHLDVFETEQSYFPNFYNNKY